MGIRIVKKNNGVKRNLTIANYFLLRRLILDIIQLPRGVPATRFSDLSNTRACRVMHALLQPWVGGCGNM